MSGGIVLKRLVPLAITLGACLAPPLLAQEHPNQARGFAADRVYEAGAVDQVNLLNGNLSLTVDIGQRYPVNAGLSYGLTLVYNSNLWKYEEDENEVLPGQWAPATVARPDPIFSAGFGWMLHMGRLFAPGDPTFNDSTRWVLLSADGSRHSFYPTLHEGESDSPSGGTFFYTRDNTYLRLNTAARTVEFPDGAKHTFSTNSHLSQILDRHGNYLNVNTSSATQWILSDSLGRTHTINFGGQFIEGTRQVSSVVLQAFNGQTATYSFDYESATFYRTCKDTWWGNNAGGLSSGVDQITVPLLKQINGPEGIVFKMQKSPLVADYHRGAPPTQPECLYSGVIEGLELPTKGKLAWSWQLWRFPGFDSTPINPSNHHQRGVGVAARTVTDPWSGDGTWAYASTIFPDPGTLSNPSREVRTTVTDPEGNSVKHFFTAPQMLQGSPTWRGWEYGLPFTWDTSEGGKYLSSETRDATNTVKRTQWVSYSHDLLGPAPANEPALWYDTNRRVNAERTKFADDGNKVLDTTQADFDGLGHYRATTRASDFDPNVSDSRTTRVQFNGSRCYEVNSSNQQTCTAANLVFQPPLTTALWVLETFSYRQANQGAIARTFAGFDADGFLLCERVVKTGTTIGANDVLILYEKEAGTGNVKAESTYGGDLQTLGTAANCTAPASFAYRVEHTYSAGVRSSSRYRRTTAANDFLPFYSFRADIDAATGLVKTSYDTAGYPTALTYDSLGRLKMAAPHASAGAAEKGAKTCYDYPAIGGGPARVKILRDVPSGSTCAGSPFGESELTFDGFGRVWKERVKMADGSWSKRVTGYNALGWKGSVSEQIPDATGDFFLPATRYQGFDAFGRPGKIVPPDAVDGSSPHAITLSYAGIRQVSRTVNVATAAGVETASTTTETYDGHGRLLKVQEPNGAGTATVSTTYQYDMGNRLTRVCQGASGATCGQERLFGYDNRGFLNSETHPEKGGPVTYGSYDARGHAGFKTDGVSTNKLLYAFDKAERLKEVWEDLSPTDRLLKRWTYDTASGRGGGKLHVAEGYNYFASPISATIDVIETYAYSGVEGRVSQRTTLNQFNSAAQELFTQTFDFDAGGNLLSQTYPSCANGGCGSPGIGSRTVTYGYTNGTLTSVPGWASSIGYHANGMVASVAHSNLVTDTIDLEPADNWMQRPWKISTSGVNFSQNFATGEHSYDGAGNISSIGPSSFLYDKLSRLTSSTVYLPSWAGGSASQGYTFDAYGNITAVSGTNARSTPTSAATNRLTGSGVSYDAAGNLTCWGGTTVCNGTSYQVDKLNRLQRMTTAAGPAQEDWVYVYTADDERFWSLELSGSESLWTLRDLAGNPVRQFQAHLGWSKTKDSIYRDGQLLAADHPDEGVRHYHLDHLSTPRLTTNPSRNVVAHHTYFPFGEEVAGSTTDGERLKFTGHERDLNNLGGTGDDLDYMHARFCSPVTGRFLSLDPVMGNSRRPLSWNRYAYAIGNPLKWVDPSGEVISLATLSPDQRAQLLKDLEAFTGNTYAVNENLELVLAQVGASSSKTATDFLSDLIKSDREYNVVSTEGKNQYSGKTGDIEINFRSFEGAKYGKVDPRTFNLGSTLIHELHHASTGSRDEVDGVFRLDFNWTGPTVDFENKIRAERGLPLRAAYGAEPTMSGHRQKIRFNHVKPRSPERIFYVTRRSFE